jgi:hypothetical protein
MVQSYRILGGIGYNLFPLFGHNEPPQGMAVVLYKMQDIR